MSPKFGDGHSLKYYAPELLADVIFNVYNQHTQIMGSGKISHLTLINHGNER